MSRFILVLESRNIKVALAGLLARLRAFLHRARRHTGGTLRAKKLQ
jgi:hypothetical protein